MNVKLDPQDEQEVKALATETGQHPEDVLRELVQDALRHRRQNGGAARSSGVSFLEAAERLGAVGCVKGGPSDVASNPAHLEGFGEA